MLLRRMSYYCTTGPDGVVEGHSFRCFHCQHIVDIPPKADVAQLGGRCSICDKMICPGCVTTGVCDPFEEKLKREEASYHALRSYGLAS